MAGITEVVFSGVGSSIITALIALYIHRKSQEPPTGRAYEILKGLGKHLRGPEGEHYVARSANDNYDIARHIYSHADGEVVATAFQENPIKYGESDLARSFRYGGSLFTRISCEEVCDLESEKKARESLTKILKGSSLVVIPEGESFTKVDGIFCRLRDNTYLAFVAFRDPGEPSKNKGIVFRNGIAQDFFAYYDNLATRYADTSRT